MLYALCRTQWRFVESADGEKTEFAWQPHVTILVTRTPAWSRGRQLLLRLDSLTPVRVHAAHLLSDGSKATTDCILVTSTHM
jgi:hypothetical protein